MIELLASHPTFAVVSEPLDVEIADSYDLEETYDSELIIAPLNCVLSSKHSRSIIIATTILYEELQEETERTTPESNQVLHEKMDIEAK